MTIQFDIDRALRTRHRRVHSRTRGRLARGPSPGGRLVLA